MGRKRGGTHFGLMSGRLRFVGVLYQYFTCKDCTGIGQANGVMASAVDAYEVRLGLISALAYMFHPEIYTN